MLVLPQRTVEPEMKFDPFTVKVKAAAPAVALVGEIEVRFGTGFCTGGGADEPPFPPQFVSGSASAQIKLKIPNVRNRFLTTRRLRIALVRNRLKQTTFVRYRLL